MRAAARYAGSEAELVALARGRFSAAGLDAPAVTVAFTPGPENCGGFQGRYYSATETVSVCDDEHASDLVLRTTVLHEMSHAWTHHHLDAANRAAFVELRNTPTWDSWDFAWSDREPSTRESVMAWGLMDVRTFVRPVGDTSRRALEESFRLLPISTRSTTVRSHRPSRPISVPRWRSVSTDRCYSFDLMETFAVIDMNMAAIELLASGASRRSPPVRFVFR